MIAWSVLLSLLPNAALAVGTGDGESEVPPIEADRELLAPVEDGAQQEDFVTQNTDNGGENVPDPKNVPAMLLETSTDGYSIVRTETELNTALAQWQAGALKIRLDADIAMSAVTNISGAVDLDLNGHTWSVRSNHGRWSFALGIEPEASVTIRNGRVACTSAETCAISVFSGTLSLEDVTVTGPNVLCCTSFKDKNDNPTASMARIDHISRCALVCDPPPSDGSATENYRALTVRNGASIGAITDTSISGGNYGIYLMDGSIDSISSTVGQHAAIDGKIYGIQVRSGKIRTIENYEIRNTQTEQNRLYSIDVFQNGAIESITNCDIPNGITNSGSIGTISSCGLSAGNLAGSPTVISVHETGKVAQIERCTMEVVRAATDTDLWTAAGINAHGGRVDKITECSISSTVPRCRLIQIYDGGSVGLIAGNTLSATPPEADGYPHIYNGTDGTIETLGENTLTPGGEIYSFSHIKKITAAGTWDASGRMFTAESGWVLRNNGILGELTPAATEAEFLAALERQDSNILLGADIEVQSPGLVIGSCVLDLGEHTLTVHSDGNYSFAMAVTGSVVIRNGTITCSDPESCTLSVIGGNLKLEKVSLSNPTAPLACIDGTRQINGTQEAVPGRIDSIVECRIIGGGVPEGTGGYYKYEGLHIRGNSTVGKIQDSVIAGGYTGIGLISGTISNLQNAFIYSFSALDGACAIENTGGEIGSLQNCTFRTADGDADIAAIRNRAGGTIRTLGNSQVVGSASIYNEGKVEQVTANGEWNNDNSAFHAYNGWVLFNSGGSGLKKLDAPVGLAWGETGKQTENGEPVPFGAVTWRLETNHQSEADVHFYRLLDNGQAEHIGNTTWRRDDLGRHSVADYTFLRTLERLPESGTYFFTVQAVGDYVTYRSSSIVQSDYWKYTKPVSSPGVERRLPSGQFTPWDGEKITFSAANGENVLGCYMELRYSKFQNGQNAWVSRVFNPAENKTTETLNWEWINRYLRDWGPGYYTVAAYVASSDITAVSNSPESLLPWYYYDGGSELTKLDTPQNLAWGDSQITVQGELVPSGAVTWQFGGLHQEWAEVVFYRRLDNGQAEQVFNYNWHMYMLSDGWVVDPFFLLNAIDDDLDSGTYYFTVQALGDGTQYRDSDIATSPDWTYVRPENCLPQGAFSTWDGEKIVYSAPENENNYEYFAEVLYAKDLKTAPHRVFSRFNPPRGGAARPMELDLNWFRIVLNSWGQPGYYYLNVKVISRDVTKILSSSWTRLTVPYYYDGGYGSVVKNLEGIASSAGTTSEIQSALNNIGTQKLLDVMSQTDSDSMVEALKALEEKAGITTEVRVESGAPAGLMAENVSVAGAALNVAEGMNRVSLVIGASEKNEVIPTMYQNTISFSMTLNGTGSSSKLAVPVQITMPVPSTINPDFLVVLHHRADGTCETIPAKIKTDGNSRYAVFCVTGFSDFTMTESASGIVLGTLSVHPGGGSISVKTGSLQEPTVLAVASYAANGQLLGTQTFSLQSDQPQEKIFSLETDVNGTMKAFAVKSGSWVPVSLELVRSIS